MDRMIKHLVEYLVILSFIFSFNLSYAEEQMTVEQEKEKAQNPYANDFGPDKIDVSNYPPEHQENYKLFVERCSRCHTIARPINSQFSQSDEWERYVKRMMRKPGCEMPTDEAKKVWQFLVYDSQTRKLGEKEAEWKKHREKLLGDFKTKYPERYKELYEQ